MVMLWMIRALESRGATAFAFSSVDDYGKKFPGKIFTIQYRRGMFYRKDKLRFVFACFIRQTKALSLTKKD